MALCGTWIDSPEMENEALRAIILALLSSCHWHDMMPLGRSRLPFHHSSVPPVQSVSERAVRQKGQAPQSLI
ncbi:hypothetical protein NQZ68_007463 [Dissostichus eleginoides]|nr:hypothetical protein NQZ68_007463 [Dissostichus eleginoides]